MLWDLRFYKVPRTPRSLADSSLTSLPRSSNSSKQCQATQSLGVTASKVTRRGNPLLIQRVAQRRYRRSRPDLNPMGIRKLLLAHAARRRRGRLPATAHLCRNSWKTTLLGKPWRQIRMPSRTPLQRSWSSTRWGSSLPAWRKKHTRAVLSRYLAWPEKGRAGPSGLNGVHAPGSGSSGSPQVPSPGPPSRQAGLNCSLSAQGVLCSTTAGLC